MDDRQGKVNPLVSERSPGAFQHRELLEDLLLRAGNDLVVVEPLRVQYGDYETIHRYTVSQASVSEWKRDRSTSTVTGTWFESAADAELWIVVSACAVLRDASGLPLGHWLIDREEELPAGFALRQDGDGVVVSWMEAGSEHRARFGGALSMMSAAQFSTIAYVPIDRIESCALEPDSRAAFAAAAVR